MITDDRMEQLLRETFRAHEHLADQPPAHVSPPPRRGRTLVAAAAAVVLAAGGAVGGAALLARDGGSPTAPLVRQSPSADVSAGRVLRTDAQNKAGTVRLVERSMVAGGRAIAALPGGVRPATSGDVRGLRRQNVSLGAGDQIMRSAFFLADDPDTKALANYVAAHPPKAFTTDGYEPGEPNAGVGGSSNLDGSWSDEVFWNGPDLGLDAPGGVSLLVQLTPTGGRTGIRLTAFGSWWPARPALSYLDDPVTSIDVTYRKGGGFDAVPPTRTATLTDAAVIRRLVSSYNQLPGWPESFHSCPFMGAPERLVAVFHTADHDLTLRWAEGCYGIWEVKVDGRRVPPYLTNALDLRDRLIALARQAR
jgi:hypothetical protein